MIWAGATGHCLQRDQSVALTTDQISQFHARGYVTGIPLFRPGEVARFHDCYERLLPLLPPDVPISRVNWWHKRNRFLYDLCLDPRILDHAECLLGPRFFLWGSQFFSKEPGDGTEVPWHQDSHYWPLSPQHSVTVFMAWTDCDSENAAMRVVPGTHRGGLLHHHTRTDGRAVLRDEIDDGEFDPADAVDLVLRAGQISLHHDAIVHGSGPNHSSRRRVGFTCRFSASEVLCDLAVWPNFRAYPARGVDAAGGNPIGEPPTAFAVPTGMFQ
ncbi:MAG: phytanoyl-CoA dioxygenase family protein [Armatimonadetes bacterium]|nr:phytanoyl-CoA dioxygenase family protein [Armatimonadota bacterium]